MFNPARIIIAVIVIAGLGGASYYTYQQNKDEPQVQQATEQVSGAVDTIGKTINISEDGKSVSYEGIAGESALDTLKSKTDVKVEDSSFGQFVSGISDVAANTKKEYWAFYVNGELAVVGAGEYIQKTGDQIEWRLESL